MAESTLLTKAANLVSGQRKTDYGDAQTSFNTIASIWSALLHKKLTAPITAQEVALLMIGMKAARLSNSTDHEDSWVDIAGYASLGGEGITKGF
jgi:hypothetical protein